MKQIILTIGLAVSMLLSSLPSYAYDFEVDGIYYSVISPTDLTCEVVAGDNKYAGDVCVRFSIKIQPKNGAPVSHIIKTFKLKENRTSEELESMPNYLKPNYNDYNLEKDYHLILKPKK